MRRYILRVPKDVAPQQLEGLRFRAAGGLELDSATERLEEIRNDGLVLLENGAAAHVDGKY